MAQERTYLLPSTPATIELTRIVHGSFNDLEIPQSAAPNPPKRCARRLLLRFGQSVILGAIVLLAWVVYPDRVRDVLEVGSSTHDFILVGAGPAGSAIAYHLGDEWDAGDSRAPNVLILEAGGPSQHATGGNDYLYNNLTVFDVPLAWSYVAHLERYHWHMEGEAILAKAVGGCGVHNAMLYVRAMPQNVESWNMTEFTWKDIFDQYIRLEDFEGSSKFSEFHGVGGPMMTSSPLFEDLLGQKFLETTALLGMEQSGDFNEPKGRNGAGYYHFNIRHGVREGAAATLLTPTLTKHPSRIRLREFTTVDKLNFVDSLDEEGHSIKRVDSLQMTNAKGDVWNQPVSSETRVIITAGAVNTPALLMRCVMIENVFAINIIDKYIRHSSDLA